MTFISCFRRSSAPVALTGGLLVLWVLLCGCVTVLYPYNQPSQEKLRLESPTPERYTIRVAGKTDYRLGAAGRVTVDVPQLERGCASFLFGFLKVNDTSSDDIPAIHVKKDDRTVQKLSLDDLAKLPIDEEGYRLLKE